MHFFDFLVIWSLGRQYSPGSTKKFHTRTFNYDIFKQMYDQGNVLKNIVADFDEEKIVIKTEHDTEADPEMNFDNQGSTDKVKQMAKSAMNRRK